MQITKLEQVQKLLDYNGAFWVTGETGNLMLIFREITGDIFYSSPYDITHKVFHCFKSHIEDLELPKDKITFHSWLTPPPLKEGEEVWCEGRKLVGVRGIQQKNTIFVADELNGYDNYYSSYHALPCRLLEEEEEECGESPNMDYKGFDKLDQSKWFGDTTKEEYEHYTCPELENAKKLVDSFLSDWEKFKLNKGE